MITRRVVIKIGGSVLVDENAFADVAIKLAGYLRKNPEVERLYVIVSAMKGKTERIIGELAPEAAARSQLQRSLQGAVGVHRENGVWERPRHSLALLWGEIEAAHLLYEALGAQGLRAKVVTQLGPYPIATEGAYLHGRLDIAESRRRFGEFERACRGERIVILSGFGAVNARSEPTLFGRNASDYVAAILSALDPKVELVLFLKDVGGIFEGFRTAAERRIAVTDVERLRESRCGQVLDGRVLDIIACDFHVVGSDLESGGTIVHRARTA